MKLTKKQKENMAAELLPFIIQSLYNAKKTMTREVHGTWWEIPYEQLKETENDCNIVLNACRKLGIYPIYAEADGYLTHIWNMELDEILEKFQWEKMESGKYFKNVVTSKIEEKTSAIKKELEKKYKKQDSEREKAISDNIQKQFMAKYAVVETAYKNFSKLRHRLLTLKYHALRVRSYMFGHPDVNKLMFDVDDFVNLTKKFMKEYEHVMSGVKSIDPLDISKQ